MNKIPLQYQQKKNYGNGLRFTLIGIWDLPKKIKMKQEEFHPHFEKKGLCYGVELHAMQFEKISKGWWEENKIAVVAVELPGWDASGYNDEKADRLPKKQLIVQSFDSAIDVELILRNSPNIYVLSTS